MKMKQKQKFSIQDFEANGTLDEISRSLSKLQFDVSCTDINAINEINDNEEYFYDDGIISCKIFPIA